ncbi:unnamed protein product [Cunninghamella blakesleeana]
MTQETFINKDVYLKTYHGGFFGTTNNGIEQLKLAEPSEQCRFTIVDAGNDTVAFKTYDGDYICANNASKEYSLVTVEKINGWERFKIFRIFEGKYSIYSTAHNSYLRSYKHRILRANASYSRQEEYFEIIPFPKVTTNKKDQEENETEDVAVVDTTFNGSEIIIKTNHESYVRADSKYYPNGRYGDYVNAEFGGIKQLHELECDHLCKFEVIDAGNDCVAFKSIYDKYISALSSEKDYNIVFVDKIGDNEKFKIFKNGKGWNLYSPAHNKYVSATYNSDRISANATKTRDWELFEIINMPKEEKVPIITTEDELIGSIVYIRTHHNKYVIYSSGDIKQIDTLRPGPSSQFKIVDAGNGCVGFECSNGGFMRALGDYKSYMLDTAKKVDSWETFKISKIEDKWSIYSPVHKKYVRAYTDEKINADADKPQSWESFEFIKIKEDEEDEVDEVDDAKKIPFNIINHIFLPNRYVNGVAAFDVARGSRVWVSNNWDDPLRRECDFGSLIYHIKKYRVVLCYRKGKRVYLSEDLTEKVQVDWIVPFTEQKEVKRSYYDKHYIVMTDNDHDGLKDEYRGCFVYPDFIHPGDKVEINKGMVEKFVSESMHKRYTNRYNHHDFNDGEYTWDSELDSNAEVNAFLNLKNYIIDKKMDTTQVDNAIAYYKTADRPSYFGLAQSLSNVISYYDLSIGVSLWGGAYMLKSGYGMGKGKFWIVLGEKIRGTRDIKVGDSSCPFNC